MDLKEIDPREGCLWLAQSYFCKMVQRRKLSNFQELISYELLGQFPSSLLCGVMYMEGIKCVNLIEIGQVVIEYGKRQVSGSCK